MEPAQGDPLGFTPPSTGGRESGEQKRRGDIVGEGSINEFKAKMDLHLETEIIWWVCWWNCKAHLEECQE